MLLLYFFYFKMKHLLVFVVLICTLSCEHNSDFFVLDVQDRSIEQAGISEIAETLMPVFLETTSECLLSEFSMTKDDSLLFILSDSEVYLFGTNGKFYKKLTRKGRGPGEITVMEIGLDKENKELIVRGQGAQIIYYKYDGTVVSQSRFKHPYFFIKEFSFCDPYIWAIARKVLSGVNTKDYEIWALKLDKKLKIQDSIRLFRPDIPKFIVSFGDNSFSLVNNMLYVNVPSDHTDRIMRDTLYHVDGHQLKPILHLNYGNYHYRKSESQNIYERGYPIILEPVRITKRFLIATYTLVQDNDFILYTFCYDFRSKKKYNVKNGFDDNICKTGNDLYMRPVDPSNDEFYYYKQFDELPESFPKRTEKDNPVLFIITLKK